MRGIDFSALFDSRGGFVWDTTKGGMSIKDILKFGKELRDSLKGPDSDEQIMKNFKKSREGKEDEKEDSNEELRKSIEQYKQEVLEQRREQKSKEEKVAETERTREKINEAKAIINAQKGYER